jgi:glutamate racemase
MKIAVFDSGIGGITVLKELRAQLPTHDFVYYGDTANVPYGTKSPSQIKKLVIAATKKIKKLNNI